MIRANKSGELNDYSVCTTWGIFKSKYYLLDISRKRLEYPDLKREVHRLRDLHRPHRILVEDKASGTQLIQELKGEGIYEITPLFASARGRQNHAASCTDSSFRERSGPAAK
jgi:predicted phage terminase large subunit-like protein